MSTSLLDRGPFWLGLYTGTSLTHNSKEHNRRNAIFGVRIPRYRFAGLASNSSTAKVRTEPFILTKPELKLDANIQGSLRVGVCDAFGKALPGLDIAHFVPVTGDSPWLALRWKGASTSDLLFQAISLRVEWDDGTIYGLVGNDN